MRFDAIKYDETAISQQAKFKRLFNELGEAVDADLYGGQAKSRVLRRLEEAFMWVGKAIKEEQMQKRGGSQLG